MFAEVVVDIKNASVDKTFYYRIPDDYIDEDLTGYRVEVSFAGRVVQGYIVDQKKSIDFDESKIKIIKKIKDDFSVLTKELILLSKFMAEELFCTRIAAIETMLPTILKNKYVEYYKLLNEDDLMLLKYKKYFNNGLVEKKILEKYFTIEQLGHLLSKKSIKLVSIVKDQVSNKKEFYIKLSNYSNIKLTKKQKLLVDYLLINQEIKEKKIKEILNISSATVKNMISKGILERIERISEENLLLEIRNSSSILNDEQQKIFDTISQSMFNCKFSEYLLHGVTGSGKTEIYIKLVEEAIKRNKESIILVPEIILTPQLEKKFKYIFGDNVALLHSRLNKTEKYKEWKKIKDGKVKVCLGTRSAVFAPFENLELIIIDEEHESSYKQTETPRYDAKDIAKKRMIYNKGTVLFASATPAIDSYYYFEKKSKVLSLKKRFSNNLPDVKIVYLHNKEEVISEELLNKIVEKINKNEQIILLVNKRGYTNFIRCFSCGYIYKCENCDISLNYHKTDNSLHCHLCNYHKNVRNVKKCCDNPDLVSGNYGIQKVEEYLYNKIPNVKITRMDADTTTKKNSYENLLSEFREHKSNILLGTQMISKGLDFPNVTLVGVLSIDAMIAIPSFRANERLFQLLVQTAGRAGRSEKKGEVILQTSIDSEILNFAINHDYDAFYKYELARRNIIDYPPFCNISFITIKGYDEDMVSYVATAVVNFISEKFCKENILGPNKSLFYKVNNEYKYNIIVRYQDGQYKTLFPLLKYISNYFTDLYEKNKISITIDNSALDYI